MEKHYKSMTIPLTFTKRKTIKQKFRKKRKVIEKNNKVVD